MCRWKKLSNCSRKGVRIPSCTGKSWIRSRRKLKCSEENGEWTRKNRSNRRRRCRRSPLSGKLLSAFEKNGTPVIEEELKTVFAEDGNVPDILVEAMLYSLTAGGKRLRPLMVLAAAEALAGPIPRVPAAAMRGGDGAYVFAYSRRSPAMDNDDYRRGKLFRS